MSEPMKPKRMIPVSLIFLFLAAPAHAEEADAGPPQPREMYGERLPCPGEKTSIWWAYSGWKIGRTWNVPENKGEALWIRAAGNEAEAAQLVVRPRVFLKSFLARGGALIGPSGARLEPACVEVLRVSYVDITRPTDKAGANGPWPDPLPPFKGPVDLAPGVNHPFWVRVTVPRGTTAGSYRGQLHLEAKGYEASVPLKVEVYGFDLPDQKTVTTAFGFSPDNVWHYQKIQEEQQRREVLDLYWANFSAHHISPYNPAPLDPILDDWPLIKPVPRKWEGGRKVTNESRSGQGALLVWDDNKKSTIAAGYRSRITLPEGGVRLRFGYRTMLPNHGFIVSLNHHDRDGEWMWGKNRDIPLTGDGTWQTYEKTFSLFPEGAKSIRLWLRATPWSEEGTDTGAVWYDDLSLTRIADGQELLEEGGFEPRPLFEPVDPARLEPKLDFRAWDRAVKRAMETYFFNSIRLFIPGMGGGSYHALDEPMLLGYSENTKEYERAFVSYCGQVETHLKEKGWLDKAYVYWFDEPSPDQYAFVKRGFFKLKRAAPGIGRMLTEQVEPGLVGGPNIWCPLTSKFAPALVKERQAQGERFWWYVCTAPKAPYAGLFIDHPATEMRVWLWQTFKRGINGILVWQTNYWTSNVAYPDPALPQNPYEDPMGWVQGYDTPEGARRPWGNGDGRFIYPPEAAADGLPEEPVLEGPVDSIRWEMLRDGIEDYEYLALLKRLIEAKEGRLNQEERKRFEALLEVPPEITSSLTVFTRDPAPIKKQRHLIARAIESLFSP